MRNDRSNLQFKEKGAGIRRSECRDWPYRKELKLMSSREEVNEYLVGRKAIPSGGVKL